MTTCDVQLSGAVDLYFYGELPAAERLELERQLRAPATSAACAGGFAERLCGAGDTSRRERAAQRRLVVVHGPPPAGD